MLPLAATTELPDDAVLAPAPPALGAEVELRVAVSAATSLVKPGAVIAVGTAAAAVMSSNWLSASAASVA